ncbi:MAG TPA: hypothetical protein VKG21_04695 [Casimicrobiaceae bacterium]|nr:hypothetical protein [Casimicrobiaceae bacterium]
MMHRFNLFQAMMLRWRELYPYSAVHALRVDEALAAARLEDVIAATLEERGLIGLELDCRRGRYVWGGGAARAQLHVIGRGANAAAALDQEMERQLNIAFAADGKFDPFRFFAVDAGTYFHLGVAYDHVVAGGDSIARLLMDIAYRYRSRSQATRAGRSTYAPLYAKLFWRERVGLVAGLSTLHRLVSDCRHTARPRYSSPEDGYNAFTRFRIDAAGYTALAETAATWGVTRQDVIMATTLLALSPLAPARRNAPRRRDLALASIVNIRRELGTEASDAFGPCLASFRVAHPVPLDIGLRELAIAVHEQTERVKRRKLYLQTLLAMSLAGLEWRFLSRSRRLRFFAKHYPVWAGVTPLNVAALSEGAGKNSAPQYVRAVSTGPLAPMILALTTSGSGVEVGISFRTTVYGREAVQRLATDMLDSIDRLAHGASRDARLDADTLVTS